MAGECRCLVCGCCAADHNGWSHPWTGDVELLLTAAAEAIGDKDSAIRDAVGDLALRLFNERTGRGE